MVKNKDSEMEDFTDKQKVHLANYGLTIGMVILAHINNK